MQYYTFERIGQVRFGVVRRIKERGWKNGLILYCFGYYVAVQGIRAPFFR